jgi:hypothetical protein
VLSDDWNAMIGGPLAILPGFGEPEFSCYTADMKSDPNEERFRRLERKVDNLTWLIRVQTALLALLSIAYLLQISRYLLLFFLIAVPTLFIFRRSLPQAARYVGMLWGLWERRRVKMSEPPS